MSKSKSRIGDNNPLDMLFTQEEAAPQAAVEKAPPTARAGKCRVTVLIDESVADRTRDVVFWTPGESLSSFAERALLAAIEAAEEEQGKPFPKRKAELPLGRPIR